MTEPLFQFGKRRFRTVEGLAGAVRRHKIAVKKRRKKKLKKTVKRVQKFLSNYRL